MTRRRHSPLSTTFKAGELAMAAPQVIAHRLARMAVAGPLPSSRDSAEFQRMWSEKVVAFNASWNAMAAQSLAAQQAFATSLVRQWWAPWTGGGTAVARHGGLDAQRRDRGVLAAGLRPVHRTTVANAKRLSRR